MINVITRTSNMAGEAITYNKIIANITSITGTFIMSSSGTQCWCSNLKVVTWREPDTLLSSCDDETPS